MTRLCHTRNILSVNGKFPGPRLVAREGDRVVVKVVNHVSNNVTIHWYALSSHKPYDILGLSSIITMFKVIPIKI